MEKRSSSPSALLATTLCCLSLLAGVSVASAGDLVRGVRSKLSAGDLLSAEAQVEDYLRRTGADAEYLDALGWLARGALLVGQPDRALELTKQVRAAVPEAKPESLTALGAAIEVESRLLAMRQGKEAAVRFLEREGRWSDAPAFRSRLMKNVNLLSLEGAKAPPIATSEHLGPAFRDLDDFLGRPVVLFLWAHWCGDCRAQVATLARVKKKYEEQGVVFVALTRFYGTAKDGAEATPAEEKAHVATVLTESYGELGEVRVPFSTDAMIRYGASATPTFAFIDRAGIVRSYTPTRLREAELERRIDQILATSVAGAD